MIHNNPDIANGVFKKNGSQCFFFRLWPSPVFLCEEQPGVWHDVEDVDDDFNLSALTLTRERLIKLCRPTCPDGVDAILMEKDAVDVSNVPDMLKLLGRVQNRIIKREKMLQVIPTEMLRIVRRFPEQHFMLLKYFYENPRGNELLQTNPALAYMLSTHKKWTQKNNANAIEDIYAIQHMKRVDILKRLGFENADNGILKLIGKIEPGACRSEYIWRFLKTLEETNQQRLLRHLPRINLGCMAIIASPHLLCRVSHQLLHEVANDSNEDNHPGIAQRLESWLHIEKEFSEFDSDEKFFSCKRLNQVVFSHILFVPEEIKKYISYSLPESPLRCTPVIQALKTSEEVYEEGCKQCNCIFSKLPEMVDGRLFAYRIFKPERATLTIRKHKGKWIIDALETAMNKPVSNKTREYVRTWLEESRNS